VLFGRQGGHGIFRKNLIETVFKRESSRALNPDIGGNPTKDNGCQAAPP
jgi:hypothetical protein